MRRSAPDRGREIVIAALAGAALFVLVFAAWRTVRPGLRLDMQADRFLERPVATGFFAPEIDEKGTTFAWTGDRATLRLPGLDRRTSWRLTWRLRAPGLRDGRPARITIDVDGVTRFHGEAPPDYAPVSVQVPPAAAPRSLIRIDLMTTPAVRGGPTDARMLGVQVDSVTLEPDGFVRPPRRALLVAAACGFAFGACLAALGLPLASASLLPIAAIATTWLLARGIAAQTAYASVVAWGAIASATAAIVFQLAAERLRSSPLSTEARWTLAGWALLAWLKACLILSPAMFIGDMGFHQNRLRMVEAGEWFFSSEGPGGAFPYPIAYYLLISTLDAWVQDPALLLRLTLLVCDALLCLAVYPVMAGATRDRRLAAAAVLTVALTPTLFHVQAVAYLTNGFGNVAAAAALLLLLAPAGGALAVVQAIGGGLLALTAMLSHVSSAAILFATLIAIGGVTAVAGWRRSQPALTRAAAVTTAVAVCAAALACGLYYVRFAPALRAPVVQPASAASSASAAPPVQRVEPHQTQWVPGWPALVSRLAAVPRYVQRSYGWPLAILAIVGLVTARRRHDADRLTPAIVTWLGVGVAFWALAMLTPVDLRYYLAAAPAVALLGAAGLVTLLRGSALARIAGTVLAAWLVWHGVAHACSWLA